MTRARTRAKERLRDPSDDPEVFFALFSASSPAHRQEDGSLRPVFDRRPVWVVRFPNVRGKRQSGVIVRRTPSSVRPTVPLDVVTEVVVIIDDETGKEVLRSEYKPEAAP